jgi:hypothetical protein
MGRVMIGTRLDNLRGFVLEVFALAVLATASLVSASAGAQTIAGEFRGTYVCERLPTTREILRVPLDLSVRGSEVQFSRPLLTLNGSRVLGSEMARGTIDADGRLHLRSQWTYLGNTADAEYSGTLTPRGGTLIGTQTWTNPAGGAPVARSCTAALVPASRYSERH